MFRTLSSQWYTQGKCRDALVVQLLALYDHSRHSRFVETYILCRYVCPSVPWAGAVNTHGWDTSLDDTYSPGRGSVEQARQSTTQTDEKQATTLGAKLFFD